MKKIFNVLKWTGIAVLTLIALVGLYLVSAYCLSRIAVDPEVAENPDIDIYILSNGVHTDLVLPIQNEIKDWREDIHYAHTRKKDTVMNYVTFGWGDKGFYLETPTWADLKVSTAFKAAFSLSSAAMHATFHKQMIENDQCRKITISKSQYQRLVDYVSTSLTRNETGESIWIETNANYGGNDAFYEAGGNYSLFHTCNSWANNGLKSCGQKASFWTPFDTGIFYHYTPKK